MNRRTFLTVSGLAGLAPLVGQATAAESSAAGRDFYELRQYQLDTEEQRKGFDAFMAEAAIPALNRLGVRPVGVFAPDTGLSPIHVLLRHKSLDALATLTQRLTGDPDYRAKGAAFLDAPAEKPAYKRIESSLLVAFTGMPQIERPVESPGRVFQLRIYESPSTATNQKKIEMFNLHEIAIFRKVGLHPVFFGEALVGSRLPNLTYMLSFESMDEQKANWKKFGADPDWQKLRAMPEYADKKILSNITNLSLRPTAYSQL